MVSDIEIKKTSCNHPKAWLAQGGHYYCPDCETPFKMIKCACCKGEGYFYEPIQRAKQ